MTERVHVYQKGEGRYFADAVDRDSCTGFGESYEGALADLDIALSLYGQDIKTHVVDAWHPTNPPAYLRGNAGESS